MPVNVAKLTIVHYPDPVLRRKAAPVKAVTDEVRRVAAKMLELMHAAPGVGLAAPQVGLSWRLFVANPDPQNGKDLVFINPVVSEPSKEQADHEEGCLSIPHVTGQIRRPTSVTIEATDLEGQRFTLRGDDLPARVWQHELDHLDGVLILDRMTPVDRLAAQRQLKELEAQYRK